MATTKQKKALANMVENGGNAAKAMREAGYSDAMANNPQKMTRSQGFQKLMEMMGVTDDKLVGVMKEGLEQPDHAVRHKYLETSLRVKGIGRENAPVNPVFVNIVNEQGKHYDL